MSIRRHPRRRDRGHPGRGGEQGAVAPLVALMVAVIMVAAAFAVDLGMQRVVRADMQSVADLVALDMARQLDGRTRSQLMRGGAWTAAVRQSVERNGSALGDRPEVVATPGRLDPSTGAFVEIPGGVPATAVRVTASAEVPFVVTSGSGRATRAAVAEAESNACFVLGSYAAAVRSGQSSLLGPLLGQALGVSVIGHQGLAAVEVRLGAVAAALGVGTVDELVEMRGLTLAGLLTATAEALGQSEAVAASILRDWAETELASAAVAITEVIGLEPGNNAALAGKINVLELVAGAVFAANGDRGFGIEGLGIDVGLTGLSGEISVVQRPQIGCGRAGQASAQTAQIRLKLAGTLLPGVADLSIQVDLAAADALVTDVDCTPDAGSLTVAVRSGLVAPEVTLRLLQHDNLAVQITRGAVSRPSAASTVRLELPQHYQQVRPSEDRALVWGPVSVRLPRGLPRAIRRLQAILVEETLMPLVAGVLTRLDALVIGGPVERLVGVRLAGADLRALPTPSCANPALRD